MDETPIKTELTDLDKIIGGLYPGEILLIGSRPAIGKSSLIRTLIKKVTIEKGIKSLLFSLEIPKPLFQMSIVVSLSGISTWKILLQKLEEEELKIYNMFLSQVEDLPIIIDDTENNNINDICNMSRKLVKEEGIEIIYLDYLGLITINEENPSIEDFCTEVMTKLKGLARELNIPIVLACQVSRTPEHISMRGICHSSIIDNSDVILLLDRKRNYSENPIFYFAHLDIVKNNYGDTGGFKLRFMPESGCFENLPLPVKEIMECR